MALDQWTDRRRELALMVLLTLERLKLVPTTRPSSHRFALRAPAHDGPTMCAAAGARARPQKRRVEPRNTKRHHARSGPSVAASWPLEGTSTACRFARNQN